MARRTCAISPLLTPGFGEKDLAIDELSKAAKIPSDVTYGQLRLHPYWDSLRGDARFEKVVASPAPK